jgi:hypothetical protein
MGCLPARLGRDARMPAVETGPNDAGAPSPPSRGRPSGPLVAIGAVIVGALAVGAMLYIARRTPGPAPEAGTPPAGTTPEATGAPTADVGDEETGAGGAVEGHFDLAEPTGTVSKSGGFTFRWASREPVAMRGWKVKVQSENRMQVWSSSDLTGTELAAPPELLALLEPGDSYLWRIVARPEKGRRMRSGLARFTVVK